jgi:integral membrane protein (TIGR01906 family)
MNRTLNKIVSVISAITGFIFILYLAVMPTAMNRQFFYEIYDNEEFQIYQKDVGYGLNYNITMNKEDIKKALDHTLKFMLAEVDDLQIMVSFSDGSTKEFYEHGEILHMEDCQKLFVGGRNIAWICFAITVIGIGILILNRKNFDSKIIKYFFFGLCGIVGLIGFIGLAAAINFDAAFIKFHEIFFPQGNWTFSYRSYMIQMLPQDLVFQSIVYHMVVYFFIYITIVITGLIIFKKLLERHESLKSFKKD